MIKRNVTIGKNKNVTTVDFGGGTVHFKPAIDKGNGDGFLIFKSGKPRPIGDEWFDNKKKGTLGDDNIELLFYVPKGKTESIDVVIHQLQELKKFMLEKLETKLKD